MTGPICAGLGRNTGQRALLRLLLIACLSALSAAFPSGAQAQDARLARRFEPHVLSMLTALIDSAEARGVPREPLIQKALEGASKDATSDAILRAVRVLGDRLVAARSALGAASRADLVAGAGALEAGAGISDLRRLRPFAGETQLTNAFLGLTFLLQRGVTSEHATNIVASMLEARLSGSDFVTLQRLVDQDIRAGAPPVEAARVRSQALILHTARVRHQEEGDR